MRFDAAHKLALAWFDHLAKGGSAGATTVREVCSKYVEYLRSVKTARAANDAEARFRNYVLDNEKLAALELSKLMPSHLEAWRNRLREMPTRSGGHRGERAVRQHSQPRHDLLSGGAESCLRRRARHVGFRVAPETGAGQERRPATRALSQARAEAQVRREGAAGPRAVLARPGLGSATARRLGRFARRRLRLPSQGPPSRQRQEWAGAQDQAAGGDCQIFRRSLQTTSCPTLRWWHEPMARHGTRTRGSGP